MDSDHQLSTRVLLVDDDRTVSTLVGRALEAIGCEVRVAHDGVDGLELGLTKDFDLVLLDQFLPGLLGVEILARWKQAERPFPVIMLTAANDPDEVVRALELGAADYIRKPFAVSELQARVKVQLRRA